ncbi:kinesin-like protein KIF14-like [Homarus americanus]|uniref:Kinesin-like protein KIF14-like n=1 Tax=Homarus americanus TaxID=6706 RepID=A0A8J5K3R0_HOMAM|nr:kinesin-like protein KIF14-like [Homarus americanus]
MPVLITSQMGKKDQGKKCDLKDTIKTKVKTSHHTPNKRPHEIESVQISHKTPTNASNTACAVTPRTPAAATTLTPRATKAHLSDTVSTTPRTPATYKLRTSDSQGTTPCPNPSPVPCSVKSITARLQHTPLQSSVSKTSATNTPRQCPTPNVSLPKRFRQEDDTQKTESSHISPWVRPPKNAKDVDGWKKDDDGRRKDNLNRVLSSTTLNVPSPFRRTRVSSSRLSGDSKTPTSGRSSGASKHSFGSGTQTPNSSSRRSSASHSRPSNRSYPPSGGLVNLTPEVVSNYHPVKLPTSPGIVNCYGGAESTSVSVGVRVRPLSSREQSSAEMRSVVDVVGNNIKLTTDSGTVHCFTYDHCFWSLDDKHPLYASQEAVYNALAQPLLEKAYEGYNTCLFAYGQTGSGKSYTDLLSRADYLHSQNPPEDQLPQCRAEVELSYIEIYNERIYDLLSSGGSGSDRREALRVREHPKDGPYVEGVAHHLVSSYDHLQTWLMLGNKERSIAATGVNDKSSRSHAVFTIKLTQMQVEDVEGEHLESSKVSIINLVDLAGSERVAAAQSQGDRLKEGVCINKSLLTLGKVITALAESEGRRRPFIPYRESVLTYLLKESLGGNSRTAMIATVSPCNVYLEETLSTLRYAQQARMIIFERGGRTPSPPAYKTEPFFAV